MPWTAPRVEEIATSAEIGEYQNDLDRGASERERAARPETPIPARADAAPAADGAE